MTILKITEIPDRIKIAVTEDHITDGKPESRELCPVALAAWDAFGQTTEALWVISDQIIVRRYGSPIPFMLPDKAVRWLTEFDDIGTGDPIEFVAMKGNWICEMVRQSFDQATHN